MGTGTLPQNSGSVYCPRAPLVLDPLKADIIQTSDFLQYGKSANTVIVVDYKGYWYYGLCPVKNNGKWGIIDAHANFILPFTFDEEPKIGFMSYAGPGPMIPEELRIMYKQGNHIGYYLIKGNNQVVHEIVRTKEEWEKRAAMT